METGTKQIIFRLGDETKHVIEEINHTSIEGSLFTEQYRKALSSLDSMFSIVRKQVETDTDNTPNNILSFIGDRGSGKTSCMMSFANMLKDGLDTELKKIYKQVAQHRYFCMERIDPSFFDESHNVIELFLAGLYNAFEKKRENQCGRSDYEKETLSKGVIERFANAQMLMSEMTKLEKDKYDELDSLQNLSAGIRLWSVIGELVKAFLNYFGYENGVLVLPIDDIDLNSRMAADMMEQIRKFLIQPNVIVLLAVKLDQLEMSKSLSLVKEYEVLLRHDNANNKSVIGKMVDAYITKLLPHPQRIYMPDGTAYFNQKVIIEQKEEGKESISGSVRQIIPELIYKKTRYLFYNSQDKTSYIVPTNLRELRFFTALLCNMKDYWKNSDNHESNLYNKLLFRKYLYENWVPNNLDKDMQFSVSEIINTQDSAQVNAIVLAAIKRHFFPTEKSLEQFIESHHEAAYIFDDTNINYNIAIGDVLDIIDFLEECEQNTVKLKLLFLIRSFYSIRLYHAYEQKVSNNDNPKGIDPVEISTRFSGLNLSEYDKLVAGYFINTRLSRIIPRGKLEKDTRSERRINFEVLGDLIEKVVKNANSASGEYSTDELRLIEFFLLGISRRFGTQNSGKTMRYRTDSAVFYAEQLTHIKKNAYFDVGALLYNLTRMEDCYKRFDKGDEIYKLAAGNPESLYCQFHLCADNNGNKKDWDSLCCFRNAEIIKAFRAHAETVKSSTDEHVEVIAEAFKYMGKFEVSTYDKNEKGEYNRVKFDYLRKIGELLGTPNLIDAFKDIFEKDYRPDPEKIDVSEFVRGAKKEKKNRLDSKINRVLEKYSVINKYYQGEVKNITEKYGTYVTREELEQIIKRIDSDLEKHRS